MKCFNRRYNMDIGEVIGQINNSFHHCSFSCSSVTPPPRIINLIGINKKDKEECVKALYDRFVKYGKVFIVLLSISTSAKLFQWIMTHASQVCFWNGRVCVGEKRVELMIVTFADIQLNF